MGDRAASTGAKGDFKVPVAKEIRGKGEIGLSNRPSSQNILRLKVC